MELSLPLRSGRSRARRPQFLNDLSTRVLRARRRPAVRAMFCLALVLPLLAGGWLWLRGSSLVAIRHVHIVGVRGPEAVPIREALDRAAEGMTTVHFDAAALRAAVAQYPLVASLSASTAFPHSISIRVSERQPVAVLVGPGQRTGVAADGTVLGPALAVGALPTLTAKATPAPGLRVGEASALAAVTVLGAAPGPLLRYVARVYEGPEGLTLQMRNGLLVYFGDATLPHAKWLSLARVLSSPEARGALYVDVRLPSRPAAGFTLDTTSQATNPTAAARIGSADPTAATLAERLTQGAGVGSTGAAAPNASGEEERSGAGASQAGAASSESEHGGSAAPTGGTPESSQQGSTSG